MPVCEIIHINDRVGDRFTVSTTRGIIGAMNMWTSHDWTVAAVGMVALLVQVAHGLGLWPARSPGAVVTGIVFGAFGLTCIAVGADYETRWGQPLWATVSIATAAFAVGAGYAAPWLVTVLRSRRPMR